MHKVFVSYHHTNPDQSYRNEFERLFALQSQIMISKSVQMGEINPTLSSETIRQKIRDEYLADSTVTIVLIGQHTWQRKHVDWEISSSIRDTKNNSRSGLLGILLPGKPDVTVGPGNIWSYNRYTVPPRLYKNVECGFAKIYGWSTNTEEVASWIELAFNQRKLVLPDNSYDHYVNNRTGDRWY